MYSERFFLYAVIIHAIPIQKLFPVSGTKLAAITIDGGMCKGSAFTT